MYQIALCEDEKVFSEMHEKACREIIEKLHIECHISVFECSMDFLAAFMEKQMRYDLILLDVDMDGIDGIELARRIRRADGEVDIIFITANQEYAIHGYDVNALHYLIKPLDTKKLESLIKSAHKKKIRDSVLVVKSGKQHCRIPVKSIVSLETVGRQVKLSMIDKDISCPGKLVDVLTDLPEGQFVRCHQAYAVNVNSIQTLTRKTVVTINGKEIPVSRTYLEDTREAFLYQMGAR